MRHRTDCGSPAVFPKVKGLAWLYVWLILSLASLFSSTTSADDASGGEIHFSTIEDLVGAIERAGKEPGTSESAAAVDGLWARLIEEGRIPFVVDDRACFLYRGEAKRVAWRGDFNRWEVSDGTRVGKTDVWMLIINLPADGRSDYKLFLDDSHWSLDPWNPRKVSSGMGPNSELRMPQYIAPREAIFREQIAHGELTNRELVRSSQLGYEVPIRIYLPAGWNRKSPLPTVYVADGQEYAESALGNMITVVDNLVADQRIRPALVVFIDPSDPQVPGRNRRAEQYVGNDQFVEFLTKELVHWVEQRYATSAERSDRTILGTSLGGLLAAYVGIHRPEIFGNLGIQSPAFQVYPQIYDLYRDDRKFPMKIFLTGGTLDDNQSSRTLLPIAQSQGYEVKYLEVHEGHSWGAWRSQLDDLLEHCVGP
jgi:enterochelin esterase-like enzyme